jgi:hypothetical protein
MLFDCEAIDIDNTFDDRARYGRSSRARTRVRGFKFSDGQSMSADLLCQQRVLH